MNANSLPHLLQRQRTAIGAVEQARHAIFEHGVPGPRSEKAFALVAQAENMMRQEGFELACACIDERKAETPALHSLPTHPLRVRVTAANPSPTLPPPDLNLLPDETLFFNEQDGRKNS